MTYSLSESSMFKRFLIFFTLFFMLAVVFADAVPILTMDNQVTDRDAGKGAIISLYRVKDIYHGATGSWPEYLAVYNGDLYFKADGNDGAGNELWKYNTTGGAQRVTDIYSGDNGPGPYWMTVYNGALYFSEEGNDGAGTELWNYTPAGGAQRVEDLFPGAGNSIPSYLTVYNGALYFAADVNDGAGRELWNYTPAGGARRVVKINSAWFGSDPKDMTVYNGALYFAANGGDGAGRELWKYTPAGGAKRVEDIRPGTGNSDPQYLTVYNGALYFSANGNDGAGTELWKYDPVNGAQRVTDIYHPGNPNPFANPSFFTEYNGALYFAAMGRDGAGTELWKYDPVNGADRVADIAAGSTGSYPTHLAVYNGALYFNADGNDGAGYELWLYSNSETAAFRSVKSQDGWVLESGETTNKGGTLNAGATTFNVGDDAQDKQYRSILSFDTSTLPDAAVITDVTLKIRRQGLTGTNPFTTHGNIKVDIRKGPFSGNKSLQAEDFQAAASKSDIGTIRNLPDVDNWYSTSLMSTAYTSVNTKGLTQVRLRFSTDDNNDNGADFLRFYSGNAATISDRPLLQVTYYVP